MNENSITVTDKQAQVQNVVEIDMLDLLANFLLKWKVIVALLLAGAVLGYGWARFKNADNKMVPVEIEKAVEDAGGQLAENKAVAVEQLFFQYVNYLNLQKEMRTYYSSFVASDVTVDNTVQMNKWL